MGSGFVDLLNKVEPVLSVRRSLYLRLVLRVVASRYVKSVCMQYVRDLFWQGQHGLGHTARQPLRHVCRDGTLLEKRRIVIQQQFLQRVGESRLKTFCARVCLLHYRVGVPNCGRRADTGIDAVLKSISVAREYCKTNRKPWAVDVVAHSPLLSCTRVVDNFNAPGAFKMISVCIVSIEKQKHRLFRIEQKNDTPYARIYRGSSLSRLRAILCRHLNIQFHTDENKLI